jgi:hypothetical protein
MVFGILFCHRGFKTSVLEIYSFQFANLGIFSELCKKFGGYF